MYYVVGVMSSLIESMLLYLIVYECFERRIKKIELFLLAAVADSVITLVMNQICNYFGVPFIVSFIYEIFIIQELSKAKLRLKIFVILIYNSILLIVDTFVYIVVTNIFHISFDMIYDTNLINSILSVISRILLCAFIIAFFNYWKRKREALPVKYLIPIYIVPMVSIWTLFFMADYSISVELNWQKSAFLYLMLFGLIVVNSFVVYLYDKILESEQNRIKLEILQQQVIYYSELKSSYSKSAAMRHDYEKHLYILSMLIEEERYEELKDYISKMKTMGKEHQVESYTNNIVLDAIISEKHQAAEKMGIDFFVSAEQMGEKIQEPMYLCILFGNILDNALEACERILKKSCENAYIKVRIYKDSKIDGNGIYISVINSSEKPVEKAGTYISHKGNPLRHGFGLKNVEEVVCKMNGTCVFGYEDKEFYFVAKLPVGP